MPPSHQPHFLQPLLPGFETGLKIPTSFFARHVQGHTTGNTWSLRSDVADFTWEVLQEETRLTDGWKEFVEAHDLRVGDIVIYKLKEQMVLHVSLFGPSCCEILYNTPPVLQEAVPNTSAANVPGCSSNVAGCSSNVPEPASKGTPSAYWDYSFRAEVTETNIREDKLVLPVEATACPGLDKQFKEAILVNIDGKPWTVRLRFSEAGGFFFIKGWRKFCCDNKNRIEDLFAINVVGDGTSPPLLCVYAPSKEILGILKTWKKKLHIPESSRRFV